MQSEIQRVVAMIKAAAPFVSFLFRGTFFSIEAVKRKTRGEKSAVGSNIHFSITTIIISMITNIKSNTISEKMGWNFEFN